MRLSRYLVPLIAAFALFGLSATASAQITVHAEWQPPAVVAGVPAPTSYTAQWDAGPALAVGTALDPTCNCLRSVSLVIAANDTATHTITVVAIALVNGVPLSSPPRTATVNFTPPGAPALLTIKVGP